MTKTPTQGGGCRARASSQRPWIRCGVLACAIITMPSTIAAQTAAPSEEPLLGWTLNSDTLNDLPTSNNPFTLIETIPTEVIGDRFSAGGLNVATAPRFGGFLNSWTQTQFRVGDISITDPRAGGTPLLLPFLPLWERMTIATGAMGLDENAPGLSMTLEPPRPRTTWFRSIGGALSAPPLVSDVTGLAPAVDRVRQWQDGNALVSGPVTDRLGLVAAASWRRLSHVVAPSAIDTTDRVASAFAHVVFSPTPRDEVRALGWAQQAMTAALTDTAVHVQSTWERRTATQLKWRVFGGYTERSQTASIGLPTLVVDNLSSDPVSDLVDSGPAMARRWVAGARMASRDRWVPAVGVDVEGAQVRIAPTGIAQIGELVNGVPARLWRLYAGGGIDVRHLTTVAAFANEQLTFGPLILDAGVRLDTVSGSADTSARGIQWTTWLPRTSLRWNIADTPGLTLVASYRRTAYQLPLNVLAIGDPAAPVADVSLWNGASPGALIARVGPGTGGDPTLTQLDPLLQRPITDELVLAVRARPFRGVQVEIARVTKREERLLQLADVGLPAGYTAFQVPEPGLPGNPVPVPQVTVYNRPINGYGRDRYLLTNRVDDPARSWALELTVRATTDRFTILAGGALTWAVGPAAAVGFRPTQNDQDVLGNLFVDPNDATGLRGQLFPDRSHVVKIAGIYRFPWRVRLGAIARYQDGQPFARLVVVPNLTQGTTAIRAYPNGGTAFTYTGTLDVRLQKLFTAGRSEVAAVLDVYNLPNLGNEVAEHVVSGPIFRTPTALQPPRTMLLGLRVTF